MATIVRNERTSATVPAVSGTWDDEMSAVGAGSVVLQLSDAGTVAAGDVLTVVHEGEDAFSFTATRDRVRTLDPDISKRQVTWSGEGLLSEWADWIVTPPNPIGDAPEGAEVRYDWTSCDISDWDDATERAVVGDQTALPPHGLAAMTDDMPNPLSRWLAPRAAIDGADPTGTFYVGVDFTLATDTYYVPYWLADDLVAGALDGVLVSQFVERENMASHTRSRPFPLLKAGTHRWRWKVENVARDHPQNCGLFAFAAAARSFPYGGLAIEEDWIHTSCIADGFKTLDYGADEPGRTVGYIINEQTVIAQANDRLVGWTFTFNVTHDSAGNPWPIVQQRFRAGMTLLDMLRQMQAAGLVEFRPLPGQRTLEAFLPDSAPTGPTISASELRDLEHDRDRSSITSRILVRDDAGRLRWFGDDSGPAAFVELGGLDSDAAIEAVAQAQLAQLNEASTSVTFTHLPADPADGPYRAYRTFSVLGIPNPALDDHDAQQVRKLSGRFGAGERAQVAATVASRRRMQLERQEIAARRQTPGVVSDAVAPASPLQPQEVVLERFVEEWGWSGRAADATNEKLTGQPFEVKRPMRILYIEIAASDIKASTDASAVATEIDVLSSGSPLPLGLGEVRISADELSTRRNSIYLAQPGEILQPILTSPGTHVQGTIRLIGSYLPL